MNETIKKFIASNKIYKKNDEYNNLKMFVNNKYYSYYNPKINDLYYLPNASAYHNLPQNIKLILNNNYYKTKLIMKQNNLSSIEFKEFLLSHFFLYTINFIDYIPGSSMHYEVIFFL